MMLQIKFFDSAQSIYVQLSRNTYDLGCLLQIQNSSLLLHSIKVQITNVEYPRNQKNTLEKGGETNEMSLELYMQPVSL